MGRIYSEVERRREDNVFRGKKLRPYGRNSNKNIYTFSVRIILWSQKVTYATILLIRPVFKYVFRIIKVSFYRLFFMPFAGQIRDVHHVYHKMLTFFFFTKSG